MSSQKLPLEGVRILDLTTVIMGPYTTQVLGDFGADVIKIEEPEGDMTRVIGPSRNPRMSSLFLGSNRNKRSVILNLKKNLDKNILWKLIDTADMFVHNIRPQKIKSLGFDPDKVLERNPKIIYGGLHGYREDGPYGGAPAYDDVIQGQSGISGTFISRDNEPNLVPTIVADKSIALMASSGLLAAYIQQLKTRKGSYLEVSMFEGMVGYVLLEHQYGNTFVPSMGGEGYPRALSPQRKPYKTIDGYICILAYTDKQWKNFWTTTDNKIFAKDERFSTNACRAINIDELYNIVAKILLKKTSSDWLQIFKNAEIPSGAVNTLNDLNKDPHLIATNFFRSYNHPTEGHIKIPDTAFQLNRKSLPIRHHQPKPGEQTEEILREAGIKEKEIKNILKNNFID